MRFAEPSWLWAGAPSVVGLCLLVLWSERRRSLALARFVAGRHLSGLTSSVSSPRRWLLHALRVLSVACFFVALARPQWGYHLEAEKRAGVDVLFAVDSSKSMLAQDLRPSRLVRAKLAVEELGDKLPGARLGLVVFAGDAFLQTPLTADRVAFQQSLDALDTTAIPVAGTNLQSAIRVAKQAFVSEPEQRKILVLLTDGEDLSDSVAQAARAAADGGIVVHAIGVGTSAGATIPIADSPDGDALLRDPSGQLVHSRLDEGALRELSSATGGSYHALEASGQGALQLYRDALSRLPKQLHDVNMRKVFDERFQWPLGLGMALLLLSLLVHERRARQGRAANARQLAAVSVTLVCGALAVSSGAAAQDRSKVEGYNDATGRYRAGDFEAAAEGYRGALATPDVALQERAYYDLGNSLYRQGQASEPKGMPQAMERYKQAISAYESALALDEHDEDARFNRDFVRAKLQQLEQRSQQQADSRKRDGGQGAARAGQASADENQRQAKAGAAAGSGKGEQQERAGAAAGSSEGEHQERAGGATGSGKGERQEHAGGATGSGKGERREHAGAAAESGEGEQQERAGDAAPSQGQVGAQGQTSPDATAAADKAAAGQPLTAAGALTKEQAARLLDALEGELRQLPSGYATQRAHTQQDEEARRDW